MRRTFAITMAALGLAVFATAASADGLSALTDGGAVGVEELEGNRAKGYYGDPDQYAVQKDNYVSSYKTGDNSIGSSFAGSFGVYNVVQNTGNAALIQQSNVVNVNFY